ncbi:MAG: DUF2905 domain-containing protein [Deltaproteobacteria bacterium]|nr:MAG: DUF2905 domain-containing protein [Deltaproteobacteria bacterium]
MEFNWLGKTLLIFGLILAACGLFLMFLPKIPFVGKLPGDIYVRRGNFTFYFPLTTCIILSILLSLIFYLFRK